MEKSQINPKSIIWLRGITFLFVFMGLFEGLAIFGVYTYPPFFLLHFFFLIFYAFFFFFFVVLFVGETNFQTESLNDADVKLDTQLKTTADKLDTEIANREDDVDAEETARIAADNAINTEMDADSTFLKTLIDDENTALQSELDKTQTGAGLDANGDYAANGSSNYIKAASSLKDADNKLDSQLKLNTDILNASTNYNTKNTIVKRDDSGDFAAGTVTADLIGDVTGNVNGTLTGNLTGNVSGNLIGDVIGNVTGNLTGSLTGHVNGTSDNVTGIISVSHGGTGASTVTAAQTALGFGNVDNTSDATKNAATANLTNKTIDAAKNSLSNITNSEIKAGAGIDATKIANGTVSDSEFQYLNGVTSAIQAQLNLKAAIASPALTGTPTAPTALLTDSTATIATTAYSHRMVTKEKLERKAEDDAIRAEMSTENENFQTALVNEISIRNTGDLALQAELNKTQTGAGLKADGTYDANEAANYISSATSLLVADNQLDAKLKTAIDNLAAEISARNSAITAETTARGAADVAIRTDMTRDKSMLETALAKEVSDRKAALVIETSNRTSADAGLQTQVNTKAPLISPTFTGLPKAPTLASGNSSTSIATTAFVQSALSSGSNTLDQAYDQGGQGAGKTITADKGAFTVAGTDGIISTGNNGSGATLNLSDDNAQFVWYPKRSAFRVGAIFGDNWSAANIGNYSIAMGIDPKASFTGAVAIGSYVVASKSYSIAIGCQAVSSGDFALALGQNTVSDGNTSTAMGKSTKAVGDYSTSMGLSTIANANNSTAMGWKTTSNAENSLALGRYNIGNTNSLLEIGNGSYSSPKNIVTVTEAKVEVDGDIQTNGYFYFGDPTVVGTWRMHPTEDGLIFECKEATGWVEKMTILK